MSPPSFNERFNIPVSAEDSKRKFVNRACDLVFDGIDYHRKSDSESGVIDFVAFDLGERRPWGTNGAGSYLVKRSGFDFVTTLRLIESLYLALNDYGREELDETIPGLLGMAEVDLGVKWNSGTFFRAGAAELDEALINQPLKWMRQKEADTVLQPFQKGLGHFLEATKRPELYFDAITDFYEALEALAKLVTDRDKDLSGNAESFVKALSVSKAYKAHLRASVKSYVSYANNFRHSPGVEAPRPPIKEVEAESFMYSTGAFLRLGLQSLELQPNEPSAA